VKRNNNNSEGVDGNEQRIANVKEAPNPKRTKCNSVAKVKKMGRHITEIPVLFSG